MLHAGEPLAPHDMLSAWSFDPLIASGLAVMGAVYFEGARKMPNRTVRIQLAFCTAWVFLVIALLSPLHTLSEILFSAHMVQHTILMAIAAPLLVLSRPGLTALWALRPVTRRRMAHLPIATVLDVSAGVAFVLHGAAIWVWHIPALYDLVLRSAVVHAFQHASFFGTAMLFWHAVLAPARRAQGLAKGILYVFAMAVHTALLGALITLAPDVWYEGYFAIPPGWSLTPLQDQQIAGLIMWVPAGLLYTIAGVALVAAWLNEAERRNATRKLAGAIGILVMTLSVGCDSLSRNQAMDAKAAATATGGNPRVGKSAVEQLGCGGCHEIRGVRGARGLVGPSLNGLAQRMYIAGVLTNTPDNLARWILDPRAVDSLTAMPSLGVAPKLARDIAAYLYTLP